MALKTLQPWAILPYLAYLVILDATNPLVLGFGSVGRDRAADLVLWLGWSFLQRKTPLRESPT
jgi:hypothetical protein